MKRTWTVPVTISLRGTVEIEAESAHEARELFVQENAGLAEALEYTSTWEMYDWEADDEYTIEKENIRRERV